LLELLDLTALIAVKAPHRHGRVAARWLNRWLEAHEDATVDDIAFIAVQLQALGRRHHGHALLSLRAMADEASRHRRPRGIA